MIMILRYCVQLKKNPNSLNILFDLHNSYRSQGVETAKKQAESAFFFKFTPKNALRKSGSTKISLNNHDSYTTYVTELEAGSPKKIFPKSPKLIPNDLTNIFAYWKLFNTCSNLFSLKPRKINLSTLYKLNFHFWRYVEGWG